MYLFLTAYLLLAIPSAAAVLRQKQTPVVAIAWLLAIVLLPIGGSLFYLLAGYRKPVRDVPPTDSRPAAGIERMLWYGCSTRVRYRNRVEQLHDGGEACGFQHAEVVAGIARRHGVFGINAEDLAERIQCGALIAALFIDLDVIDVRECKLDAA